MESDDLVRRKQRLEAEKLEAEIANLKAGLAKARSEHAKRWTTTIIAVLTILTTGLGLFTGTRNYLDQRRREFEFNVSNEIIVLSRQLGSDNPIERTNAALLLSDFEQQAVPILISNLRVIGRPMSIDDTIYALRLIMKKERVAKDPNIVFGPLLEHTVFEFEKGINTPEPSLEAMGNYIKALRGLATGDSDEIVVETLESLKTRIRGPGTMITELQANALDRGLDETIASYKAN